MGYSSYYINSHRGNYFDNPPKRAQIAKLPLAVKHIFANEKDGKEGEVSSFGALCMALSATIGTGNIVGVATAIVAGGPGAVMVAMQKGIARGIFSNEAGLGSAPIAAATVKTDEPVAQGLVSMTGTVIDTLVICTLTGLSIVLTGAWDLGLDGVDVTTKAFQAGLPFPEEVSAFILMICLVFFAFTTILGWDYYSEKCMDYCRHF